MIVCRHRLVLCTSLVTSFALTFMSASAQAGSITFSGSSGSRAAQAVFNLTGPSLRIELSNTSSSDVLTSVDVLTGLFFDGNSPLNLTSASLMGSTVHYGSFINHVGEGWQYIAGLDVQTMNNGLSAAGMVNPKQSKTSFSQSSPLNGIDYGILSVGDNLGTGNFSVTGQGPLIKNRIEFDLTIPIGFNLADLGDSVIFRYGSGAKERFVVGHFQQGGNAPVPGGLALCLIGTASMACYGWRRRYVQVS